MAWSFRSSFLNFFISCSRHSATTPLSFTTQSPRALHASNHFRYDATISLGGMWGALAPVSGSRCDAVDWGDCSTTLCASRKCRGDGVAFIACSTDYIHGGRRLALDWRNTIIWVPRITYRWSEVVAEAQHESILIAPLAAPPYRGLHKRMSLVLRSLRLQKQCISSASKGGGWQRRSIIVSPSPQVDRSRPVV